MFLCGFPFFFLSFFQLVTDKYEKTCFNAKQMILTSEWHAVHLFAGPNTQHIVHLLEGQKGCYVKTSLVKDIFTALLLNKFIYILFVLLKET